MNTQKTMEESRTINLSCDFQKKAVAITLQQSWANPAEEDYVEAGEQKIVLKGLPEILNLGEKMREIFYALQNGRFEIPMETSFKTIMEDFSEDENTGEDSPDGETIHHPERD